MPTIEIDRVRRQGPDGSLYVTAGDAGLPTAAALTGFAGATAAPPMAATTVQAGIQELNAALAALPPPAPGVTFSRFVLDLAAIKAWDSGIFADIPLAEVPVGRVLLAAGVLATTLLSGPGVLVATARVGILGGSNFCPALDVLAGSGTVGAEIRVPADPAIYTESLVTPAPLPRMIRCTVDATSIAALTAGELVAWLAYV